MGETNSAEQDRESENGKCGEDAGEEETEAGNEFAKDNVAAFEVGEKKEAKGAVAFFAADGVAGGGESDGGAKESGPGLEIEDLQTGGAAGLACQMKNGIGNPRGSDESEERNDGARAVNRAIMRSHADFARGNGQT